MNYNFAYKLAAGSLALLSWALLGLPAQAATTVSGSISADTTWTTAASPYVIEGSLSLSRGNTLTIEPGVVMKFDTGASLRVAGNLVADGTADDPIIFTSLNDDSYGGDTNGDGATTSPTFQDWNGVVFPPQRAISTGQFDYVIMQYGGGTADGAILMLLSGDIAINHSTFQYSAYGLLYSEPTVSLIVDRSTFDANGSSGWYAVHGSGQVTNSSFSGSYQACLEALDIATVSGNIFTNCSLGILLDSSSATITGNVITHSGIAIDWSGTSGAPTITGNAIYNNSEGVVNNFVSYNLTVENNWWGDATGPYNATTNPSGLGNAISDSVDADPWLTSDPTIDNTAPGAVTLGTIIKDPWNNNITLNWTNPTDADFDHVQINRTAVDGSVVTITDTAAGTSYADSTIEYDTYYTYTFYAVDGAGNISTSVSSEQQHLRSPQIHHLHLGVRSRAITTRWERLPLRSAVGYMVYYGTSAESLTSAIDVGPRVRTILTGLRTGRTYYVAVAAYNSDRVIGPISAIQSIDLP